MTYFKGEELTDSLLTGGSRWPCVTRLSVDLAAAVWLPLTLEEGGCHAGRRLKSLVEMPHKEELRLPANSWQSPLPKSTRWNFETQCHNLDPVSDGMFLSDCYLSSVTTAQLICSLSS